MALASAAGALLKPQTPLQQLLEDINFQRTKEMRQLLKDDSGFVVLQGTTYWTDLFVRHFLFQTEPVHSIDSDDLLFFVRKKHVKSSSRHMPKYETEVEVFRKDSRKLPIGDPDVDWEETVYLNMVIHQFDYTLTLAICTRTSPKELQVLRRHSQRVYASPSRRKMDTKGEGEEITYPHICFMVDNFDEVFSDILVRDGEMVCVELVANDKDGSVQGVIFLGSIRYDALKKVYDARQSSLSSKVAQRMSFGLFSSGASVQTRCEFVRMKGPQGKGHAEMAVTKPKGSGVETPTSEPGFCATDMWDEWEEENDDYCTYRHQRRLSDPSSNLNNFTRYGWRTKNTNDAASGSAGAKARSENEGLDSLASEVSEIEAGDLRDDLRPAFSASEAKLHLSSHCAQAQTNCTAASVSVGVDAEANTPNASNNGIDNIIETIGKADENNAKTNPNADAGADVDSDAMAQPAVEVTADLAADAIEATANASTTSTTTGCSNCFGGGGKKCKRWVTSTDKNTPEMSEIYCPSCEDAANETPACLNKMPDKKSKPKHKTILSMESELIVSKRSSLKLNERRSGVNRSASLNAADKKAKPLVVSRKEKEKDKEKEKVKAKEKEKEKEKDKSKSSTKTTNLLAKVSPKRMRAKVNEKTKSNNKEQKINNNIESTSTQKHQQQQQAQKGKTTSTQQVDIELHIKEVTADMVSDDVDEIAAGVVKTQEYEIADDATSLNGTEYDANPTSGGKMAILSASDTKLMISVHGREELPVVEQETKTSPTTSSTMIMTKTTTITMPIKKKSYNYEKIVLVPVKSDCHPLKLNEEEDEEEDELDKTATTTIREHNDNARTSNENLHNDCNGNCDSSGEASKSPPSSVREHSSDECEAHFNGAEEHADGKQQQQQQVASGFVRCVKRSAAQQAFYNKALTLVPKRRTPDGTNIYYWCDLPKRALKELDDGAYNPLWATRGFTQTFHFWKENRRQQSTPLNAFLTYVTLPWWSIAKDLLDHREPPILTF